MSPTPQTQSWFAKNPSFNALGRPNPNPASPTTRMAPLRDSPRSMRIRLASSIIATREVHAANARARKKMDMKKRPPGIPENN